MSEWQLENRKIITIFCNHLIKDVFVGIGRNNKCNTHNAFHNFFFIIEY